MSASFRQVAPLWACMTLTACITADAWASNGATLSSWLGTQVNMGSGDLSNLLQTGGEAFSDNDMASLDATLQASGIQTANRISVLIAETGAGLSLITLFDGQAGGGTGVSQRGHRRESIAGEETRPGKILYTYIPGLIGLDPSTRVVPSYATVHALSPPPAMEQSTVCSGAMLLRGG